MKDFQTDFLNMIVPLAQQHAQPTPTAKLILPSLTIAQAIIESDWGRSDLAQHHNYFGIKASKDWIGKTYDKLTGEVYNNQPTKVQATFRVYPSAQAGVQDHRTFLLRSHYSRVWDQNNPAIAAREIKAVGYATALDYARTLTSTIENYNLTQYDKEFAQMTKIFLSPSSQERNLYATPAHPSEETICNKIADVTEAILKEHGFLVMQNDPSGSPSDHARKANAYEPALVVPIHTNAGGGHGTEVFCYNPANLNSKSTKAAQHIYRHLSALTPTQDRGIKKNVEFYEIRNTNAPCVYIEVAFHDNPEDAAWIISHIHAIAEKIAHGICDTFGVPFRGQA